MNKKLIALLLPAMLFAASCKKTENTSKNVTPVPIQQQEHGAGVKFDKPIPIVPKANFDEIRSNLVKLGYLNKLKVNGVLPPSVILNHPFIGNQGQTGTCVSWSIGHAMAGTLNNEFPIGLFNDRSPYFIYQLNHTANHNCIDDGMSTGADGMNIFKNNGIPPVSYDVTLGNFCNYTPTSDVTDFAALDKIPGYSSLSTVNDIKTALSLRLPVEMTLYLYQGFYDAFNNHQKYSVPANTNIGMPITGHAICIIGYDDSKNAVLIQNSWGTTGGDATYPGCMWIDYNVFSNGLIVRELYVPVAPPKQVAINGIKYVVWSANGTSSGNITALAGTTVAVTISAYGPSVTKTNFILNGATLTGPMGNNVTVSSGSTTQTFTMPASGSVTWSGTFTRTTSSGTGNIGVDVGTPPPPQTSPLINGVASITWNAASSASGNITAAAGALVHITVSATGAGTTTYFTMHDAPLTGNPSGVIYMQNNSATQTFTMPSSGSVHWDATFSRTGTSGTGAVAVF